MVKESKEEKAPENNSKDSEVIPVEVDVKMEAEEIEKETDSTVKLDQEEKDLVAGNKTPNLTYIHTG